MNKERHYKNFCPLVKTSCPPAENVNETPGLNFFKQDFFLIRIFLTCGLFTCSSYVRSHNTRFSDAGNLYVNKSRLSIRLNSFSIFGAKSWNCLKPELCKLRKKPFKNKMDQFLFAVLGDEILTLISKLTCSHNN